MAPGALAGIHAGLRANEVKITKNRKISKKKSIFFFRKKNQIFFWVKVDRNDHPEASEAKILSFFFLAGEPLWLVQEIT